MNQKLKIKFVDFWPGFIPEKSYFFDMLGGDEKIELSDSPVILIFSNYGIEHKKHKCFKVFFSAENERPNMFKCDIALTFDYKNNKRHFRLPLFVLYMHHYKQAIISLEKPFSKEDLLEWRKRKFCCMIVSNGKSKERLKFYEFLSEKIEVDSGGRFLNNIGGSVENKLEFIKGYKYVISFENSSSHGYVTEKILEPFLTNSIPVYWGAPDVHNDFNKNSFINVGSPSEYDQVYDRMHKIDGSADLIIRMLNSPKFNKEPDYLETVKVRDFILNSFNQTSTPISCKYAFVHLGRLIDKINEGSYWARHYTIGNFR